MSSGQSSFRDHLQAFLSASQSASDDEDDSSLKELSSFSGFASTSQWTDEDVHAYILHETGAEASIHALSAPDQPQGTPALDWLRTFVPTSEDFNRLASLLSSTTRSNDDISSDLLDIIGFDSIELLPQILERRAEVRQQVEQKNLTLAGQLDQLHLGENTTVSTPADSDAEMPDARSAQGRLSKKQRGKQRAEGKPRDLKFALHAGMTIEDLEQAHLQKLEEAANRPLIGNNNGYVVEERVKYPHVYANQGAANASSIFGSKVMLPVGTTKLEHEHYSEVTIPAPPKHPSAYTAKLLPVASLPPLLQRSFPYQTLNRLQSLVYPTAYETTENMLVCAPTGAGKTDVAVLTVLRALSMYADIRMSDGRMRNKEFKIVYVAPMKALASEIVKKMQKRFEWCGLAVRELTGDMQLTRKEIAETQMIVTTPEKWDVVTRKTTGEGELAGRLRLLIIDEVHLLHEDRGAVLESIVARTLRQVESSQTLIRIVGLSATLPNYVDVADFLRVNPHVGMFFFDSSFRPVPLEQHFIAAKGKPGGAASKENLDHATFDKTLELVKDGHQVLIFVHARKDTVKTAQMLREKAIEDGELEYFDASDNPKLDLFKREISMSRNKEMKELINASVGIHHAGMLRSDRNISERLFEQNVTKVLVCTATLAWGVNLPAYAVIIKGTQLYDSSKGAFMDLSVLDVLQMFGRAGRPQYETQGVSYICTTSDKIDHYITAVNQQVPIESKFVDGLVDSLNAEISLGTVSTIDEGVRWLGYTFLHVRMRKNPMVYGISATDLFSDPALGNRRRELILNACKILSRNGMIDFDDALESLSARDLGQISAKYYLRTASIEIFNKLFRPKMTEADLLSLLSKSTEFQQVAVRESEADELKRLIENENVIPCQVKGGTDTSDGKANVLLQAYISQASLEDFALISDMAYVAQNAARIARSLLEIAMSRKWSQTSVSLIAICKSIEKRRWPWSHPLEQMSLQADLLYNFNRWAEDMTIDDMTLESAASLGKIIHQNERLGGVALLAAQQFPRLGIEHALQPLSHDLLRVRMLVRRNFKWSEKLHGHAQYFWVWMSDAEDREIMQSTKVIMRETTQDVDVDFTVAIAVRPAKLYIHWLSDTWLGSDGTVELDLTRFVLPPVPPRHRSLLHIPHQITQLESNLFELIRMRQKVLSAFEMQCLHSLSFSSSNVLVSAPTSEARYQLISTALWRLIKQKESSISLVISPSSTYAHRLHSFLQKDLKFASSRYNVLVQLAARQANLGALLATTPKNRKHLIIVSTPRALSHIYSPLASSTAEPHPAFDSIVADELNSLSPEYELSLSYLLSRFGTVSRFVGFSSSLLDSTDLAGWLQVVPAHNYSFQPSARPDSIETSTTTFNLPHSPSLLKSMVKPAYDAMRGNAGSSICFVPHRAQCFATLADFVTHSATDLDSKFATMDEETLSHYTSRVSDPKIAEGLLHGFGVLTPSMHPTDQAIAKHLFQSGAVRVLIVPRESVNTLTLTANLVIVMATQYAALQSDSEERRIIDYPLEDLLQMQVCAVGRDQTESGHFSVFTQADKAALIARFLRDGLPLESSLLDSDNLLHVLLVGMVQGSITSRQTCLDALAGAFLARRAVSNPTYYACELGGQQQNLSALVDRLLERCRKLGLVRLKGDAYLSITAFGREIARRRIGREALEPLFKLTDGQISKLLSKQTQVELKSDKLEEFTRRLPKSLQRRMGFTDSDEQMSAGKVLVLAFVAGKLPPENSETERVQAQVALQLVDSLARAGSSS